MSFATRLFNKLSQLLGDVLISSPTDGQVLTYELSSTKWKNKAAAGGGGSGAVVAAKSVTMTGTQTGTNVAPSWTDATDGSTALSITYTPTSASNNILVRATISGEGTHGVAGLFVQLVRGSTPIGVGASPGSRTAASGVTYSPDQTWAHSIAIEFLDSPATTSSTTWKVQFATATGGTWFVNRSETDGNNASYLRTISSLTIMEVTP